MCRVKIQHYISPVNKNRPRETKENVVYWVFFFLKKHGLPMLDGKYVSLGAQ